MTDRNSLAPAAQLDALSLPGALRTRLVDFALDDAYVRDPELARACRDLWGAGIAHGAHL